jgi:hypothetical protein
MANQIDILSFDAVSPCEVPHELKMLGVDGMTETGVTFLVLGAHADVVKKYEKDSAKKFLSGAEIAKKQNKESEFTGKIIDSREKNNVESAAVRITGWLGVKQEFSVDLLKQALAKNPHWITQVIEDSDNVGNFTK